MIKKLCIAAVISLITYINPIESSQSILIGLNQIELEADVLKEIIDVDQKEIDYFNESISLCKEIAKVPFDICDAILEGIFQKE